MYKRICVIMILFVFSFILFGTGCQIGENTETEESEIMFEPLYMGFHSLINSEFNDYMERKTNAFGEAYIQLICDSVSWEIWRQNNYPELNTFSDTEKLFDIDWDTECLMVYTSLQWSEARVLQHPIKDISISGDRFSIEESETSFVIQAFDFHDEDARLKMHIKYIPYEIVRLPSDEIPPDIMEKYAFSPECCTLEFQNAFISFRNTLIEKDTWFTRDFSLGIIENEMDWEKCRLEQSLSVGQYNREQLMIDWSTQMLLLYVPTQNATKDSKCRMVGQIYYDDENIYVQEDGAVLAMPNYECLPELTYQPYQILIISRTELPESIMEKYRIP